MTNKPPPTWIWNRVVLNLARNLPHDKRHNTFAKRQKLVRAVLHQLLQEIQTELAKGNRVKLDNFGIFRPHLRQYAKPRFSPFPGLHHCQLPPSDFCLFFKPSLSLLRFLNHPANQPTSTP